MRDAALLGTRLVVGSYLAVHGAQKLFGAFGGGGLERTSAGFHRIGLRPGRHMAIAAGVTELGGGVLTAAGIADPAGPLAIMGAMSVAATTHRAKGPLSAHGGFELPLTNLAAAAALAAAGPGRFRLSPGFVIALGATVRSPGERLSPRAVETLRAVAPAMIWPRLSNSPPGCIIRIKRKANALGWPGKSKTSMGQTSIRTAARRAVSAVTWHSTRKAAGP